MMHQQRHFNPNTNNQLLCDKPTNNNNDYTNNNHNFSPSRGGGGASCGGGVDSPATPMHFSRDATMLATTQGKAAAAAPSPSFPSGGNTMQFSTPQRHSGTAARRSGLRASVHTMNNNDSSHHHYQQHNNQSNHQSISRQNGNPIGTPGTVPHPGRFSLQSAHSNNNQATPAKNLFPRQSASRKHNNTSGGGQRNHHQHQQQQQRQQMQQFQENNNINTNTTNVMVDQDDALPSSTQQLQPQSLRHHPQFFTPLPPLSLHPDQLLLSQPLAGMPEPLITVVLDLDETLVNNRIPGRPDALLRPHVLEFLNYLRSHSGVEIVLWTASTEDTARPVVRQLCGDSGACPFDDVIFRSAAWFTSPVHTKDLRLLGRNMDRVVVVDNSPSCVKLNPHHAILVEDFVSQRPCEDETLVCTGRMISCLVQSVTAGACVPSGLRALGMNNELCHAHDIHLPPDWARLDSFDHIETLLVPPHGRYLRAKPRYPRVAPPAPPPQRHHHHNHHHRHQPQQQQHQQQNRVLQHEEVNTNFSNSNVNDSSITMCSVNEDATPCSSQQQLSDDQHHEHDTENEAPLSLEM